MQKSGPALARQRGMNESLHFKLATAFLKLAASRVGESNG
jgi:hypothetical protein